MKTNVRAVTLHQLVLTEVELPLEAGKLGLIEVGADQGDKLLDVVDGKAAAMNLPRDNVLEALLFDTFKHIMQLPGKGSGHSSTGNGLFTATFARGGPIPDTHKVTERRYAINHFGILLFSGRDCRRRNNLSIHLFLCNSLQLMGSQRAVVAMVGGHHGNRDFGALNEKV